MNEANPTDMIPDLRISHGDGYSTIRPQKIVAMVSHNGKAFVATEQRVYQLIDGIWCPMVFAS
jgi:hypothetical protein